MKKSFFVVVFLLAVVMCSGQAAGNWYLNQMSVSKGADMNYEESYYQAQQSYSYTGMVDDSTYIVSASVLYNAPADEYVIVLGTSQIGETLESTHDLLNKRISNFLSTLKLIGITESDVYVDFISQYPIFELEAEKKLFSKTTYQEIPSGFEVKKNIHIRYKSKAVAEQIIIEAAKNEIYDVVKVDYIVSDQLKIYESMRTACIEIIKLKEKMFAALNVSTTAYCITGSEDSYATYPIERYAPYTEFVRINGSREGKMGTKVVRRYDVPALYYNKLPYNAYDQVINPSVVDPVVQFTMTISVKYVLKKQ